VSLPTTTPSWLEGTPLLVEDVPRDPAHEAILNDVVAGKYKNPDDLATVFTVPGLGFHRSLYYLTVGLAHFRVAGRQVFVLPPTMQDMLAETSMEGVKFSEVKFPYPSFYLALPKSNLRLWGGLRTQWHPLAGILVQHLSDGMNLYLWGAPNERSVSAGDDAAFWFHVKRDDNLDLEEHVREMLADPDSKVPVDADITELGRSLGLAFDVGEAPPEVERVLHEEVVRAIRILLNAMLYLDSAGVERTTDPSCAERDKERAELERVLARFKNPNKKQARSVRKQLDGLPKSNIVWLGRSVGRTLPVAVPASGERTGRRHHWVRGHWWPKKHNTHDLALKDARDRVVRAQWEHDEARIRLANLAPTDTEGMARETLALMGAKKHLAACMKEAEVLREGKPTRRRWVQPYERNKDNGEPIPHTYVLNAAPNSDTPTAQGTTP